MILTSYLEVIVIQKYFRDILLRREKGLLKVNSGEDSVSDLQLEIPEKTALPIILTHSKIVIVHTLGSA